MAEGTSIEDIEMGNVQHSADDSVMNAILADMNAADETPMYIPPPQQPQYQPPPQQPQYQPQYEPQAQYQPQYQPQPQYEPQPQHQYQYSEPVQEQPTYEKVEIPTLKKNSWSVLFDDLRDPLVVGVLVCLFSLPALHTWLAKHATWAYKIGGSLSWIGFLLLFLLVAGIFATYRQIMTVMNV